MDKNLKTALIIGGVVLAAIIIVPTIIGAVTGWQGYGYGMMGSGMMGGLGGWWFMPILMILFWGLVIWGVVALVRGLSRPGSDSTSSHAESALEILKRRYARGEINKAEYEEKKKDLI
ncbi:MAG: hypothetical protein HW402_1485 [Dehalococcoidales bacterium]|nr:hypothetical protein [Dehalococcoidales bacterium]